MASNPSTTEKPTFNIRPWKLSDSKILGALAARTYANTPVTNFLSPYHDKFFHDYERSFCQRQRFRTLDPAAIGFLAFHPEKSTLAGYIIARRCPTPSFTILSIPWRITLFILRKWFSCYYTIRNAFFPDRSMNMENHRRFEASIPVDSKHLEPYPNRWHVESLVIDQSCQRMGLGTTLLKKIMVKATEEKVPICLIASPEGERLYKKLGFKWMGGFSLDVAQEGGGYMIWFPEGVVNDLPEEVLKSERNQ